MGVVGVGKEKEGEWASWAWGRKSIGGKGGRGRKGGVEEGDRGDGRSAQERREGRERTCGGLLLNKSGDATAYEVRSVTRRRRRRMGCMVEERRGKGGRGTSVRGRWGTMYNLTWHMRTFYDRR